MDQLPKVKNSSGQAILLVLLGMAVVLTIVLSVVARSVTDISITSKDEASSRAFSAAEAGIENLLIGIGDAGSFGLSTYTAFAGSYPATSNEFNYGDVEKLYSGEVATVWFVEHDSENSLTCSGTCFTGSSLDLCWGNMGTDGSNDDTPAVELSVYFDDAVSPASIAEPNNFSNLKVARAAFDPWGDRREENKFDEAGTSCPIPDKYAFHKNVDLSSLGISCSSIPGCLVFARIKLLYNEDVSQDVGVKVASSLPSQGRLLSSTGEAEGAARKIEAIELYKSPLSIFEAGVFSAGLDADLVKGN